MNCSGGYANCFFASSPGMPWQHGRRQLGWYISATLRKQFPYLTKQFILSLGRYRASAESKQDVRSVLRVSQSVSQSAKATAVTEGTGREVRAMRARIEAAAAEQRAEITRSKIEVMSSVAVRPSVRCSLLLLRCADSL